MKIKLLLAFIILMFLLPCVSALTIEEQSNYLHNITTGDHLFVVTVNNWVNRNIEYHNDVENWHANSTDITWQNQIGDCSEYALLKAQMLSPYVEARVVYGNVEGTGLHDTVEAFYEGEWHYVDIFKGKEFTKLGNGLHPDEIVVY